jgi:hypothetical protein
MRGAPQVGFSRMRGFLHPDQNVFNATQNSLCRAVKRRRNRCMCRASSCRRRAMIASLRHLLGWMVNVFLSREDLVLENIARILAEKHDSSFAPSHLFCVCTMFWRGTGLNARAQALWTPSLRNRAARPAGARLSGCARNSGRSRGPSLSSFQVGLGYESRSVLQSLSIVKFSSAK